AEFAVLLGIAVDRSIDALQRLRGPQTPDEAWYATLRFERYRRMWLAGFQGPAAADPQGDLVTILGETVLEMGQAMVEARVWQTLAALDIPVAAVQSWATKAGAGWVRPQLRMYASHRKVFSEFGDPRTFLMEWLPEWVWQARQDGAYAPNELLKMVRRRLDKTRQKSPRRTRATTRLQGPTAKRSRRQPRPSAQATWTGQEEARLDVSALTLQRHFIAPSVARRLR